MGPFQKFQREVIYFPYKVKKWKVAGNCPKNCSIHTEHSLKTISLMFETETVGPCLDQKLKWGGMTPLVPRWLRP